MAFNEGMKIRIVQKGESKVLERLSNVDGLLGAIVNLAVSQIIMEQLMKTMKEEKKDENRK